MISYETQLGQIEQTIEAKGYSFASADLEMFSGRAYAETRVKIYWRTEAEAELKVEHMKPAEGETLFDFLCRALEFAAGLPSAHEAQLRELVAATEKLKDKAQSLGVGQAFADTLTALMEQLSSNALPRP